MKTLFNLISVLYLVIFGALCWLVPISDLIKAIIALPSFIIVPYFLGKPFLYLIGVKFPFQFVNSKGLRFLVCYFIGIISLVSFSLLVNFFGLFSIRVVLLYFVILTFLSLILPNKEERFELKKNTNHFLNISIFLVLIMIGIVFSLYITYFQPYPLFYGSDMFRHNLDVFKILVDNQIPFEIPYLPSFHLIISIVAFIFNLISNPYPLFWISRFLLYLLYSFGIYLFVYDVTKNRKLSLIAAFIGTSILIESAELWNFTPTTIVYTFFPFILLMVNRTISTKNFIKFDKENYKEEAFLFFIILIFLIILFLVVTLTYRYIQNWVGPIFLIILSLFLLFINIKSLDTKPDLRFAMMLIFIVCSAMILIHSSIGIVLSFFIVGFCLLKDLSNNFKRIADNLAYFILIFTLCFIILQLMGVISLNQINFYKDSPNSYFHIPYGKLLILLAYPNLVSYLFLIGIVAYIFKRELFYPSVIASILVCYFLPLLDIERVSILLPPFVAYITASTIFLILDKWEVKHNKLLFNTKNIVFFIIIISLILSSFGSLYLKFSQYSLRDPPYNHYSHFTEREYLAGIWVKDHLGKNIIVISDPYTDSMVAGLSNEYKVDVLLRSQYYPEKYPQKNAIVNALKSNTSKEAYLQLKSFIVNESFTCAYYYVNKNLCQYGINFSGIVVFNIKTFSWLDSRLNDKTILTKFKDKNYFTELYSDKSEGIYIYGINLKEGEKFVIGNNGS